MRTSTALKIATCHVRIVSEFRLTMNGELLRRADDPHGHVDVSLTAPGQAIHAIGLDEATRVEFHKLSREMAWQTVEYRSVDSFVSVAASSRGCIVCELFLPGMGGLQLLSELNRLVDCCPMPIIIATRYATVRSATEAIRSGAYNLLELPLQAGELQTAIQGAMALDLQRYAEYLQTRAIRQRLDSLSDRERAVLQLVLAGLPNKAIAKRLGVSQRTIEFRRHDIYSKTGAESIVPLIRMVMRVNWKGLKVPTAEELAEYRSELE
jgi:FixJ family two-component response regulator